MTAIFPFYVLCRLIIFTYLMCTFFVWFDYYIIKVGCLSKNCPFILLDEVRSVYIIRCQDIAISGIYWVSWLVGTNYRYDSLCLSYIRIWLKKYTQIKSLYRIGVWDVLQQLLFQFEFFPNSNYRLLIFSLENVQANFSMWILIHKQLYPIKLHMQYNLIVVWPL